MNPRLEANVLRMKSARPQPVLVAPTWRHPLAAPINGLDATLVARAQSLLHGWVRDSSGLSAAEARDVVAWHERHIASLTAPRRSWLRRLFFLPGKRPPTAARNRSTP